MNHSLRSNPPMWALFSLPAEKMSRVLVKCNGLFLTGNQVYR